MRSSTPSLVLLVLLVVHAYEDDEEIQQLGGCVVHGDILCSGYFLAPNFTSRAKFVPIPEYTKDEFSPLSPFSSYHRKPPWDLRKPIIYSYDEDFKNLEHLTRGLMDMEHRTCLTFHYKAEPLETEPHIYFKAFEGKNCYTLTHGFHGPQRHEIKIGSKCREPWHFQHHVMHVFGFLHEHNNMQRDKSVYINIQNVDPSIHQYFRKVDTGLGFPPDAYPYDEYSVMHLDGNVYALDKRFPTIVPLNDQINPVAFNYRGRSVKWTYVPKDHTFMHIGRRRKRERPSLGYNAPTAYVEFRGFQKINWRLSDIDRSKLNELSCEKYYLG